MPTFHLIPESVKQNFGPQVYNVPAANPPLTQPKSTIARMISTTAEWDSPGLSWQLLQRWSYDGGTTWQDKSPDSFTSPTRPLKDGTTRPAIGLVWDGRAMQVEVTIQANKPFSWGLDFSY
jgi:hypothetical protein